MRERRRCWGSADASRFESLFERVKGAFNETYVDGGGVIRGDTQTSYILALAADLLDQEKARIAARRWWAISSCVGGIFPRDSWERAI